MDHVELLEGLKAHPYMTLIAASVVHGRATAVVVGACVVQGHFNPVAAYCILAVMDFLGDTLYYSFGRAGQFGWSFLFRKKIKEGGRLKEKFVYNLPDGLFVTKLTIGSKPVILAAGAAKMPLARFWGIVVPCSLVSLFLCMVAGHFLSRYIS